MAFSRDCDTNHLLRYGGEEQLILNDSQVFYLEYSVQETLRGKKFPKTPIE
jgi:hypothetical protein